MLRFSSILPISLLLMALPLTADVRAPQLAPEALPKPVFKAVRLSADGEAAESVPRPSVGGGRTRPVTPPPPTSVLKWNPVSAPAAGSGFAPGSRPTPRVRPDDFELPEPRSLSTSYEGELRLRSALAGGVARPRALAAADFDEDGMPDLIAAYANGVHGLVTLHRGNVDALFSHSPEAKRRVLEGTFTDAPFLSPARIFELRAAPDFVGAGDFDGDGHADVVAIPRGASAVELLVGDGRGGLLTPSRLVGLPGTVTAMLVGDINREDGLADLVLGVKGSRGPELLVFEDRRGALEGEPDRIAMPAEVTSLARGHLDDEPWTDLAVAAGSEVLIVRGRDRRPATGAPRSLARVGHVATLSTDAAAIATGRYAWQPGGEEQIAVLDRAGTMHLLGRDETAGETTPWRTIRNRQLPAGAGDGARLLTARVSGLPMEELVVLGGAEPRVRVMLGEVRADGEDEEAADELPSTLLDGAPVAALPMRINRDAQSDLVFLQEGVAAPQILLGGGSTTYLVTNTNSSGPGSLDTALVLSMGDTGAVIEFSIPGTEPHVIMPTERPLIDISTALTIDGTTNCATVPCIVLDGTNQNFGGTHGLDIRGAVTVRGLNIRNFPNAGIAIYGAGGAIIEGNFIGTDETGTNAEPNGTRGILVLSTIDVTIGGTVDSARNVISGNLVDGITVQPLPDRSRILVQGNFIGTDRSGNLPLGNGGHGVAIGDDFGHVIGGSQPGARNVLSANFSGIFIRGGLGAAGGYCSGTFICLHPTGSSSLAACTAADTTNCDVGEYCETNVGLRCETNTDCLDPGAETCDTFDESDTDNNRVEGNGIGIPAEGECGSTFTCTADTSRLCAADADCGICVGGAPDGFPCNLVTAEDCGEDSTCNTSDTCDTTGSPAVCETDDDCLGDDGCLFFVTAGCSNTFICTNGNYLCAADTDCEVCSGGDNDGQLCSQANCSEGGGACDTSDTCDSSAIAACWGDEYCLGSDTCDSTMGNLNGGMQIAESSGNVVQDNIIAANLLGGISVLSDETGPQSTWGNQIRDNFIAGSWGVGVVLQDVQGNVVGDTGDIDADDRDLSASNVIALNEFSGVDVSSFLYPPNQATGNKVVRNYVGTDRSGTGFLPNLTHGVGIFDAQGNTVGGDGLGTRNVISGNLDSGVVIANNNQPPSETTGNVVLGNYIGIDSGGATALGNLRGVGIFGAEGNTVGGPTAGAGNVISGNVRDGVFIGAHSNTVLGNYIGTDAGGFADLGNGLAGVAVRDASSNTVGPGNVISGNDDFGVVIFELNTMGGATGNLVQGNLVGTGPDGTTVVPNTPSGILIQDASGNTVGGTDAGAGNLVSGNDGNGITIVEVLPQPTTGNRVLGNSVFGNAGIAIDLEGDGVTPNVPGGVDGSPNMLQNFPVLTAVESDLASTVVGTLDPSTAGTFRLEFFASSACDASGHGEAERFLGFADVMNGPFSGLQLNSRIAVGEQVTATATDADGNTSELSACSPAVACVPVQAFGQTIFGRKGPDQMEWTAPADVRWVKGDLALVGSYATTGGASLTAATSFDISIDDPGPGEGIYYLVQPVECGTLQTTPGAESGRDGATGCGDGFLEAGEECDDGNAIDGDGCDSNCTRSACGNGIQEIGEACDDGNLLDGDGCDSNCSLPGCGNGIIGVGEACDDGGESETCDDDCSLAECGDGTLNTTAGESCDDGGESAICDFNCTEAECGDATTNLAADEACDDGNLIETDSCKSDCTHASCGDGVIWDYFETCDDGNLDLTDHCPDGPLGTCEVARCGDTFIDREFPLNAFGSYPAENCDDGNTYTFDGCTSNCRDPDFRDLSNGAVYDRKSDLVWLKNADCFGPTKYDNAETKAAALASGECSLSDGSSAGDWRLPSQDNIAAMMDPIRWLFGNNGCIGPAITNLVGTPGGVPTAATSRDGVGCYCENFTLLGNPLEYWGDFCLEFSENRPFEAVKFAFVLPFYECTEFDPLFGTICIEWTSTLDRYWTSDACFFDTGHIGTFLSAHQSDLGWWTLFPNYCMNNSTIMRAWPVRDLSASESACGSGLRTGDKECDQGNNRNGDGCDDDPSSGGNCTFTVCGNGVVTAGEVCDDGNQVNGDGCDDNPIDPSFDELLALHPGNCTVTACGNGVRTGIEQCDDGNVDSGDGCDQFCDLENCGNGTLDPGEECDDASTANGDGCDNDPDNGGNCTFTGCGNQVVTAGEDCDNGQETAICDADCSNVVCGDGELNVTAGEVCEDGNQTNGDGCDDDSSGGGNCTATACGNGVVTTGEVCDDGNQINGDGCDDNPINDGNCTPTFCGNGVATSESGEECDDGGVDSPTCNFDCTGAVCSDGYVNSAAGEICDDGNFVNGDGCDDEIPAGGNCTPTGCGNGVLTAGEDCDDGNQTNGDGCDDDPGNGGYCSYCGNGILDAGEDCDDGNQTNGDGCDDDPGSGGNCTATGCPNGVVTGIEECDDGNTLPGDGCAADCTLEPVKTVFVTSLTANGNLGGLAGADATCNSLASTAGLSGVYKAWLSDSAGGPSTTFSQYGGNYALVGGTVVANGWADLTDGTLDAAIDVDENGSVVTDAVWTGTDTAGNPAAVGTYCAEWTNGSVMMAPSAQEGLSDQADADWTAFGAAACNAAKRLYCFEQ